MKFYLAIDQGTHASRACLFDETGRMVSEHSEEIQLNRISSTHIEQDANEIVKSVKTAVARVLDEAGAQQIISACGIAIQRSSVVAWQNDGSALSPVLSWQDTRGSHQLEPLRKSEKEIQQLSGLPLSAHYGATKLHGLLDSIERSGKSTDGLRLSPLISYLLFHILAEAPYKVDHANAQRTQLFGIEELDWSTWLVELFKVPLHTLPECVPVLNKKSKAHGKLAGTQIPVTAVSGDQNAAIFGAGSLDSETALVNFGSGAFILSLLPSYQPSKKQLSTIACSENTSIQYAREGTINGAGSALAWLEKKHKVTDFWKQLPAWLIETEQPPVFINAVGGLGSPWWNNQIEPEFVNPENLPCKDEAGLAAQAVAVIESIVFMVCSNLEIIQAEQPVTRLRVCGGLSQLDGLCQRLANLSSLPVERINLPEATARGIAWLAAGKPDGWSDIDIETFVPKNDTGLRERYAIFSNTLKNLVNIAAQNK